MYKIVVFLNVNDTSQSKWRLYNVFQLSSNYDINR